MNTERMREFYERAGYRVAKTAGGDWYVPGNRVYKNFPCGKAVLPTADEIAGLCRHKGIIGVEFYNTCGIGVESGIWVVRDVSYGLHSLKRQYRQRLLRTLERESVREIDFDELFRLGTAANRESLARLGLDDRRLSDPASWRRLCTAGERTPGAGAFASFGPNGLTAYLIYFIAGETCYGLISKSIDAAREAGSNYALYYAYTQAMIRRSGIAAVTIGVQSIPPLEGVDRMKRHAGYHLEPYEVAVFLRPAARTLVTSATAALAIRVGERILGHKDAFRRARALCHMLHATEEGSNARDAQSGARATES